MMTTTDTDWPEDLDEMITCPACHTCQAWEEALLGDLGNVLHFRCRGCGMVFSRNSEGGDDET